MRSIEVVIEKDSRLMREVWRFIYFDREHWLRLDRVVRESRQTLRHKYRTDDVWSRIETRYNTMDRPRVPENIGLEARRLFCADLGVDIDDDKDVF